MANENRRVSKRKRRQSVPVALVIALLVIALLMGGLAGFSIARQTDPSRARLQAANERINELENTLTLIGFPTDAGSAEDWLFDDSGETANVDDLAGIAPDAGADLWVDDDLLSGVLDEDGEPVVVAEFDGGVLMSNEVIPEYNDQLTTQILSGYDADEISNTVLMTVLNYMASEKIIALKAAELGLDEVTDADLAAIRTEAEALYAEQLNYYKAFVTEPGMTDEQITEAAIQDSGIDLDAIIESLKADLPTEKYYNYVVRDISVSNEEVRQYYDDMLAAQKATYTESPDEYEFAHADGEVLLYNLEGYRAVRNLQIPFTDESAASKAADLLDDLDQLDPTTDGAKIKSIEAELDPLYAPLEATAAEIIAKLQAGERFIDLVDQYGDDEAMKSEPVRTEGYYISEDTFLFSTEFIEGSMLLEQPGEISSPLRSSAGIHLSEYVGEVTAGEVPLEAVYDRIQDEALQSKRDEYYQQQTSALLESANVKYYPERLQ